MSFKRKHPYLFWQFVGFGLLLLDGVFIFAEVTFDLTERLGEDPVYATIVFTAMAAGFAVLASPIFVFISRKKDKNPLEQSLNSLALHVCSTSRRYRVQTILIAFAAVALLVTVVGIACCNGLPLLAPLGIYPTLVVYLPWTKYLQRKFYDVKKAHRYCEQIFVDDERFFDSVNINTALSSYDTEELNCWTFAPYKQLNSMYLDFLYNLFRFEGLMKSDTLRIYLINSRCVTERFGLNTSMDMLWCIPENTLSDEVNMQRLKIVGLYPLSEVILLTPD